jgi:hypothetical protein
MNHERHVGKKDHLRGLYNVASGWYSWNLWVATIFFGNEPLVVNRGNVTGPGNYIIPAWLSIVHHEYNHQLGRVMVWWELHLMLFLVGLYYCNLQGATWLFAILDCALVKRVMKGLSIPLFTNLVSQHEESWKECEESWKECGQERSLEVTIQCSFWLVFMKFTCFDNVFLGNTPLLVTGVSVTGPAT